MRKTTCFLSLVCGAFLSFPAFASPIQATFTGVNGADAFGYYVGPYYGNLESQNVSLFCDDFANEVSFGQTWQANLSKITAGSDLSNTRYGGVADAPKLYQEIAWLDTQFGTQPTSQYGDLHATIWQIFDPQEAPQPSSNYWLTQAQNNYSSLNYDNFRVVTNVGPVTRTGQVQEFLTVLPSAATPEPAPALLIAAGLIGIGLIAKKARARAAGSIRESA